MNPHAPPLLAIQSEFPHPRSLLRLQEPPDSCHTALSKQVFDGSYGKPFIVESGLHRFLHFDLDCVQSAMRVDNPHELTLAYTRRMMAFLLFNRTPHRILMLGLGGGSLAKFCYQRLPAARVTAVEINPNVITLREEFHIPADDDRFRVICADGARYVTDLPSCKDIILSDACDRAGVAPELDATEFYQNARRCLTREGVFVANICGDLYGRATHVLRIREVFGDGLLTLQTGKLGNTIVLAFKETVPQIDWQKLNDAARDLTRDFGIDFSRYLRRIDRDWRLRRQLSRSH